MYNGGLISHEISSFQALSRMIVLHKINRKITYEHSIKECAAIDSLMIHTGKYSTAVRRKLFGNYKDHEAGCFKSIKGWSYGRKCHVC